MNHKNLDELRRMSVPQLTELYLDRLFGGNKVVALNADAVNFSDLKITDSNSNAVLSEAEANARAYAESRNRNAQPKSLTGLDQSHVASVKRWADDRKSHFRGVKGQKNSTD